jgi:uncharacterized membrane protein YhaH (DUF805 family)
MMPLRELFFSLEGRITRGQFLYGLAMLAVVGVSVVVITARWLVPDMRIVATDPTALGALVGTSMVVALSLFIPYVALVAKRLHDRGRNTMTALVLCILSLYANVGVFFGLGGGGDDPSLAGALFAGISLSALVAIFAEGVILRGQEGPNQYGPDPLADAGVDADAAGALRQGA